MKTEMKTHCAGLVAGAEDGEAFTVAGEGLAGFAAGLTGRSWIDDDWRLDAELDDLDEMEEALSSVGSPAPSSSPDSPSPTPQSMQQASGEQGGVRGGGARWQRGGRTGEVSPPPMRAPSARAAARAASRPTSATGVDANGTGRSGSRARSRASRSRRRKPTLNARERNARRLESNERERMRMHSLNDAFQALRNVIPHVNVERRLSKIETLTMAKHYILALTKTISEMRNSQRNQVVPAPSSLSVLDLDSSMDEDNLSVVNNLMQYVDKLPLSDSPMGLDLCPSDADGSGSSAAGSAVCGGGGGVQNLQDALVLQDSGLGDGYNSGYNSSDPDGDVDADVDVEALVGQTVVPDEILAFDPVLLVPSEWYGEDPSPTPAPPCASVPTTSTSCPTRSVATPPDASPRLLQVQWRKD
ncbi:uncharacterized protein LOC113218466 isoform X2 [Frankliniella occidentalis]|uniref:Uncharacterized protein LOC113218466 isoform X2 n=1 Tax=Frankliniella occidentalis TaxID=133901 RepID=A0A9C6X4Q8_FRAOC|nr:uncharacterized protein LOC113218466 isoform X2 [Frankliniella occidentalis]